ncbi:MAG: type VI secretion system amidase effector protein Tae4 [Betaproteobacteria bacterium]|nr:type VI secretion system amidase effector protein Tae4 [Betaproteobacteria bacterium]
MFLHVNVSVPEVGRKIGGKVNFNINEVQGRGKWTNACAVRMSYVLNRTGFPVQRGRFLTVSGADGMWYMPRVDDIIPYLEGVFGDPDIEVGHAKHAPAPDDFEGMKGILAVTVDGWGDATGHVTLWNGSMCSDACYLAENPHNRPYTPRKARLWVLP